MSKFLKYYIQNNLLYLYLHNKIHQLDKLQLIIKNLFLELLNFYYYYILNEYFVLFIVLK